MYLKKIKIGNIEIENNIFLAPMAGITDRAYRNICKERGVGLMYTEMVSAKGIHYDDKGTFELLEIDDKDRPIGVQIFGSDPEIIANTIKKIENIADIIDINMGCPAPKITNNGEGSALMKNPDLIRRIIEAAVNATNKPITVKFRKGWNDETVNAVEIAKIAEQAGAKLITIHGRTREQFYSGTVDLEIIKRVKQAVSIPVIGNGDITSFESMKKMIDYTGVDGVMVGRGSFGNPWIFDKIIKMNDNINISNSEKLEMIFKHYELAIKYKGEYTAIREMRKHISWYIKGMRNNAAFKDEINKLEDKEIIYIRLKKYFNEEV